MNHSYLEHKLDEDARREEWRLLDEAMRSRPGRPGWLRRQLGKALISLGTHLAGVCLDAASS